MPGVTFERRSDGSLSVHLVGCCGNLERWRREYDEAFLEQTLAEGGRIVSSGPEGVVVIDRCGRTYTVATSA